MASIEYINKRIEGKQKEIAKLEKKLERIHKAEATNWEVNPYYYDEYDLRSTTKDLERAKEALAGYEADLATAQDKAASRNIPAILEFLENWKNRCFTFYSESLPRYTEAYKEYCKVESEYCDWSNSQGWRCRQDNPDEYKRRRKEIKDYENAFNAAWSFLAPYIEHQWVENNRVFFLNEEKVWKDLNEEANRKYDFIIERTNAIVKVITDVSGLEVGAKGDLNGYIIGTAGTAKVQTIGAGGYNIQCFHFRTLINELK